MTKSKKRKWEEPREEWASHGALRRKGGGKGGNDANANYTVALRNVPEDYTHDTLLELHESLGLDVDALQSTKFAEPTPKDPRGTCSVMLRYADGQAANAAAEALQGQPVTGMDNQLRELVADVKVTQGVQSINPSVYITDVPMEYDERRLRALHIELDPAYEQSLCGFKFLNSKDPTGETRCVIARYKDDAAAEKAIKLLKGRRLTLASGSYKHLGARMAKPAGWMVKTGADGADKQQAAYEETQRAAKRRRETEELTCGVPLKGRVKMWKEEQGFGFVTPTEVWGPDVFVHRWALQDARALEIEEEVVITVQWDAEKGKYLAMTCAKAHAGPAQTALPGSAQQGTPGLANILPSVYISDLPVEYDELRLHQMHIEIDPVFEDGFCGCKFLESKDPYGETRCAIGRYKDEAIANKAIQSLKGLRLQVASGAVKFIGARLAKPASWMLEGGAADGQVAAYAEGQGRASVKRPHESVEFQSGVLYRGQVKAWDDEQDHGIVTPAEFWGPDVSVHRSTMIDGEWLEVGSIVEFSVEWDAEGNQYAATSCTGAKSGPAAASASEPAPASHRAAAPQSHPARDNLETGVLLLGIVKSWKENESYGFVRPSRGADVYFHRRSMVPDFHVQVGATIAFEALWNPQRGNYIATVCFENTEGVGNFGDSGLRWSAHGDDEASVSFEEPPVPSEELVAFAGEWNLDLPTVEWLCMLPGAVRQGIVGKFQYDRAGTEMRSGASEDLRAIASAIEEQRQEAAPMAGAAKATATASFNWKCTVLVVGLPPDAIETNVAEICCLQGDVVECCMLPPAQADRAALVTMGDARQAQLTAEAQHGQIPDGMSTPISVALLGGPYAPNAADSLFVSGVVPAKAEAFLRETFGAIGEVRSVKALPGKGPNPTWTAAIVRMADVHAATVAIEGFHERCFPGFAAKLTVRYAGKADAPAPQWSQHSPPQWQSQPWQAPMIQPSPPSHGDPPPPPGAPPPPPRSAPPPETLAAAAALKPGEWPAWPALPMGAPGAPSGAPGPPPLPPASTEPASAAKPSGPARGGPRARAAYPREEAARGPSAAAPAAASASSAPRTPPGGPPPPQPMRPSSKAKAKPAPLARAPAAKPSSARPSVASKYSQAAAPTRPSARGSGWANSSYPTRGRYEARHEDEEDRSEWPDSNEGVWE